MELIVDCEEIVEGLFEYGLDLDDTCGVISALLEEVSEGNSNELREGKIDQIAEAFGTVVDTVTDKAERNCEEDFLLYRQNKPLTEKWNNKVSHEVGNQKLHNALIHEDRETIKGGLIEMISDVIEIEEKKDSSYLETDMKKREKNNEKARKDMEKMGSMKNPAFEEVSTLRKGWTEAYGSVYEKKMDPVGQEDGDIDNDGDEDSSDKYLAKRRKAIGKAMKEEGEIRYPTEPKKKFSKDKNDPGVAAGRKAAKEMGLKHNEGVEFSQEELDRIQEVVKSWVE